jgi:FkbM family methyltransferase
MRVSQELLADLKAAMPAVRPIEIVDVGASNISAEIPSYDLLLGSGLARLTAFEPNPAEFSRLVSDDTRRYLPYAIGAGGSADLHITVSPGFCSTLKPNDRINAFIQSFAKLSAVTSQQTIETRRLDDLAEVERIDFLKIDIQGGELAAFEGGRHKLAGALCVQTEVAFIPIYENQPLFAEQDALLRSLGLSFFGMKSVNKYPFQGTPKALRRPSRRTDLGQWVDGDAVYIRDFSRWEELETVDLRNLFFILLLSFNAVSAVLRLGDMLCRRGAIAPNLVQKIQSDYLVP